MREAAGGSSSPAVAPPIVHDVLSSSGRPLDAPTRGFMETRFGADFGKVRVHDGARAAESAAAVGAHAYAVGTDVVFGAGRYAPGTREGDRLIAHELAHVAQGGGVLRRQRADEDEGLPSGEQPMPQDPAGSRDRVQIEPPDNGITIDVLDPLNSSLRIGGFGLPSPRGILNGLDAARRFGQPPPGPGGPFPSIWPQPRLSDEEMRQAACRALPTLCQAPPAPGTPRPVPTLTLPQLRLQPPRMVFHARDVLDHFTFDETGVPDRHRVALDQRATELIDDPPLVAEITGHTDTRGDPGHNQRLSERRATAVRDYLLARQVPALQLWSATGAGERFPRFPGDATDHLAASRNRRVEVDVRRLVWPWTFPFRGLRLGGGPTLGVTDTRARVLDADRARFDELRAFFNTARGEITALLAQSPPPEPWVRADNENVTAMLRILDALIADLAAERRIVRFDQPTGGTTAASYSSDTDEISLRPFTGQVQLAATAASLVHEYTHVVQDETAEQLQRAARLPQEHTAADEVRNEAEGKRNGSYFGRLIALAGHPLDGLATMEARWFVERFERERTGAPDDQRSARGEIDAGIRSSYAGQIARNTPARRYLIEIRAGRSAVLIGPGGAESDLGTVPAGISTRFQLQTHLEERVNALPNHAALFQGPGGAALQVISFVVFDGGTKVAEFAQRP